MNVGEAIGGIFYAFAIAIVAAVFLALYTIWQSAFATSPWDICSKMESDQSKIQCMNAHYE